MTAEQEFVQHCVGAASKLALFFVNQPEDQMMAALSETRENLAAELTETFGAEGAALFAAKFVEWPAA